MSTELTFGGRTYQVLGFAGQGASSSVWKVSDAEGSLRALKVGRSQAHALSLAQEAERILWVGSPYLTRLFDAGRLRETRTLNLDADESITLSSGAPYLLMEWCEGRSLCHVPLPSEGEILTAAFSMLAELAAALADLHGVGVCHGDIKPANILVRIDEAGRYRARLVDLGLSDAASGSLPAGGTIRYLAPEVFDADVRGDGRARDLYALALTVAEWLRPELGQAPELGRAALAEVWPAELDALLRPLLRERPAARPSAAWLARGAVQAGADSPDTLERRVAAVRRSYLAARRSEWGFAARHQTSVMAVKGEPGRWLNDAVELCRKLVLLRQEALKPGSVTLGELDGVGRVRWLTQLVGVAALNWPPPVQSTDSELAHCLDTIVAQVLPQSLTLRQLTTGHGEPETLGENPVDVALCLSEPGCPLYVLDAAERLVERGQASPRVALALARALRLAGEAGRAVVILERLGTAEAHLELAELWRRIGDSQRALAILSELPSGAFSREDLARAIALRARLLLDRGDADACLEALSNAQESVQVLETRALAELSSHRLGAAQVTLKRARVYAATDEERARVAGVEGMLFHALADAEHAQQRFEIAAEHALRASAVLEEATYLTGVASAATDRGSFGAALEAAERATLLFEHLGRPRDAARATLARTALYSSLGMLAETERAFRETQRRAREASDNVCLGYAHLAMADVLPPNGPLGRDHAERAAQLLNPAAPPDRLRAAARCLERGLPVDVLACDTLAKGTDIARDVRLEWWGARAKRALHEPEMGRARHLLRELEALAGEKSPAVVKGRALAAGVGLALGLGESESARRLTASVAEAARELRSHAPESLLPAIEGLGWVGLAQARGTSAFLPEQLSDVERLVRALGRRDGLRVLFDQVLDALVLWTGVERGLLLLRAPGERLVPRAARNLARADLTGEQLKLSYSLAARALAEEEPVVAVDAAGELPDVHASVHALKLRSVLAVPLLARGQALGVVYLDDRERCGAFGARELGWVKLVATLAAVAIADARDELLLKRSARRAERAEARLGAELARREVELEVAERELAKTRGPRQTRYAYAAIVGESAALRSMLGLVDRVTASDVPLLLEGESGVGKELIARAIHENGARARCQFVGENCAAIPEGLLESTLFGHVQGAFTGAQRARIGLFEAASGGTLFLDEIGEMSLAMQAKLLRVLQDGEVRPVGSEQARKVDVRVIAATHRDLQKMVKEGRFREDLFYRLNVITIAIPPLRERTGDVERLVHHFIKTYAGGRNVTVSPDAMATLRSYSWPGNIRQLENEVRRFLVVADGHVERAHLSSEVLGQARRSVPENLGLNVRNHVDVLETELVETALERTGGNQTRAAELLGLSRFGLQKMMKRLGIATRRPALRRAGSGLSDAG